MITVYLFDSATLEFQGECVVPKGLQGEDLYPTHCSLTAPPNFNPETQQCFMQNGTWTLQDIPGTNPTLAQTQEQQSAELSMACQRAVVSGFTSSALGTATNYPSMLIDQMNQHMATLSGDQLMCEQSGAWALRPHTASQAAQVVADFIAWRGKCQVQLITLTAQVSAATTVAAAQAVAWTNPR